MTDLIALISSGKGTIAHVQKVIDEEEWENIFIITNEEFREQVPKNDKIEKN